MQHRDVAIFSSRCRKIFIAMPQNAPKLSCRKKMSCEGDNVELRVGKHSFMAANSMLSVTVEIPKANNAITRTLCFTKDEKGHILLN